MDVIQKNLQQFTAIHITNVKRNAPHFGHKKRPPNNVVKRFLAENMGFEPMRRSTRPTPLAGEPHARSYAVFQPFWS